MTGGGRMDTQNTQYLYKEIRLNLEPSSSTSVVNIKVPPPSGTSRKLPNTDKSGTDDENIFRSKNLASASSIFHRKYHATPSSFLWRVLEDGTVLSIRATDVAKNEKDADAPLILNFRFAAAIQPSCIAFADPREHDALCMFVLDDANVLYSFTLRPDYFRKRSAIEAGPAEACRVYVPSVFSFKHPHRMIAATADQVVVALHDGGLVRLDRNKANNSVGHPWKETIYNSQSWTQGLRSLIPFQGKSPIWHGKINMDLSAATSLQVTDLGIEGASFLFTVCLDHRMRIWNLYTGQILFTGDILNAERNPQEVGKWTVDPTQFNLLQIVGHSVGVRTCATYSPIGQGEFKLWTVRAHDAETIYVEDSFPDVHLVPSAPSLSDVWTLADFNMLGDSDGGIQLWALWKNNMTYRVQGLDLDQDHVDECWQNNWTSVFIDTTSEPAPASGPCDPTDVTDKWLNLILSPGKFTRNTLETALSIYERGLGAAKEGGSRSQRGLAESVCSVIASTAALDRKSSGGMDYEQFRASSEIQWRRFHRLLLELDKQRGEAVSLSVDPRSGLAWVVCADSLSAIRECSSLERLCHNFSRPDEGSEDVAKLISTGLGFLDAFPDSMVQVCTAALRPEVFEETTRTDYERLQHVWDTTGFWRSVSEDDCSQVIDSFGQQFALVTESLYTEVFDLLSTGNDTRHHNAQHPLTDFGRGLVVKAVQETVELQWRICLSQLLLLVHMEFDWEREEDMLSKRLDVGSVFRQYLSSLRRLELIRWLATTEVTVPLQVKSERSGSFSGGSPTVSRKKEEDSKVITALEGNVGHLLGFPGVTDEPLAGSITALVASLCAADSDIEVSPSLIQCSLIRRERADLADGLSPFCDQTPFAIYVQGRVALGLKDYDSAALSFRRATVGMSVRDESLDRHSSGLLDDAEWNLLHKGPAKYYCHIVSLFDRVKAYSFVLEFAGLALQFARSSEDSETVQREMLNRQFVAATTTSRFDVAHSSLLAMEDKAMRHNSLSRLVEKMCTSHYNEELTSLPFPGLHDQIDEILASKCKTTMEVTAGVPYHQILYSWRISHNDYRGAASVLMDRIQKLKHAGEGDKYQGEDVLDTPVTKQYLLLINALSCVDAKQAWIFSEELPPQNSRDTSGFQAKRKVVTLADLRKQYQDELDRIAAIQNNQFGFEAGDEVMDIL
ncbi:hypothetical protein VD0002_g3950 [Verticillium dahliae]|uniref:DNA repair protein rad51 n=1 Tax=Verticillium dahliae TaxID=27337 RepID=A0AA44WNA8_VERDA|nr:nucleoporin Nup120/160-domain-containing protein [Verticillium dahliae]PNH34606.1 hypothetical protein BJF96_g2287 [Verticillium dahliae]PNH64885.1 hypothetical protein VD0002_g3950 [Verticillium dahliae]